MTYIRIHQSSKRKHRVYIESHPTCLSIERYRTWDKNATHTHTHHHHHGEYMIIIVLLVHNEHACSSLAIKIFVSIGPSSTISFARPFRWQRREISRCLAAGHFNVEGWSLARARIKCDVPWVLGLNRSGIARIANLKEGCRRRPSCWGPKVWNVHIEFAYSLFLSPLLSLTHTDR